MAEEFTQLFGQTGAGSGGGNDGGNNDDPNKDRKKALKELTDVFSSKNIFGNEKPAKENTQTAILEQQVALANFAEQSAPQTDILKNIADIFQSQKQDQAENQFEQAEDDKEKLKIMQKDSKATEESSKANKTQAKEAKSRGSMIGKLGGALAGGGVAAAGLGLALFASAKAAKEFQEVDGKKVAQNVRDVLELAPESGDGNLLSFFAESGTLALSLIGLGVGLGVFGVGSAAAGAAEKFAGFDADSIVYNVTTLLSIDDAVGGKGNLIGESAVFLVAMTTIAAGLALFGAGAATAALGQGAADGIASFTDDDSFGARIRDNVLTLLSIDDAVGGKASLIGEGLTFLVAMTTIASGLALFGAGAAAAGLGQGAAEGIAKFTGDGTFADQIKYNVLTLLSIDDAIRANGESFIGDSAEFLAAMTGIGAGLAVFGVGAGVSGVGMGLANFTSESGNFAEDIKDKVNTLMSIAVEHPDLKNKSDSVKYALLRIGEGISGFGSENLKSALSNFASGLVEFFTIGGPEPTPLDIAMQVADNGDALKRGADGMVTLARGFTALSRISADNDFDVNPDIIKNLTAFSSEMAIFAGAQYDMSSFFGDLAEGVDKSKLTLGDGIDRTVPIIKVANAFQALADSMDNVSESARNLVMPDISSGPELFNLGNGTGGNNIVVNNVSSTNTTVGPTIASVGINPEGQQTSNSAVSSD